jgi:DNA replication and repair protein RecF
MFKELRLKSFRNIDDAHLSFGKNVNIFIGNNGQGKSNFLEALYLLSTSDSFRYADNQNLIQLGANEAFLRAQVLHGEFDYLVQLNILKSRKNISVQGKKTTSAELSQRFPAVIFSPESLSAVKDGADQRRQLVDDTLASFQRQNAGLILEFKKCLKSRNKVLKDFAGSSTTKTHVLAVLESLNPIFLKLATLLTHQRILALKALLPEFNNAMQNISGKSKPEGNVDISVEYVGSGINLMQYNAEMIFEFLQKRLLELNDAELASGTSLVGPQKHDIKFLYNQNDSRFYCSQGQQRALILAFKMAQIVYHRRAHGAYPVLMLDDVLSELDSERRQALISFLTEIETQIFITTTDLSLPETIMANRSSGKCSVYRISGGKIHDE